jgi:hypothetical protein
VYNSWGLDKAGVPLSNITRLDDYKNKQAYVGFIAQICLYSSCGLDNAGVPLSNITDFNDREKKYISQKKQTMLVSQKKLC